MDAAAQRCCCSASLPACRSIHHPSAAVLFAYLCSEKTITQERFYTPEWEEKGLIFHWDGEKMNSLLAVITTTQFICARVHAHTRTRLLCITAITFSREAAEVTRVTEQKGGHREDRRRAGGAGGGAGAWGQRGRQKRAKTDRKGAAGGR